MVLVRRPVEETLPVVARIAALRPISFAPVSRARSPLDRAAPPEIEQQVTPRLRALTGAIVMRDAKMSSWRTVGQITEMTDAGATKSAKTGSTVLEANIAWQHGP